MLLKFVKIKVTWNG